MLPPQAKKDLIALLGPRGYLDRPEDLLLSAVKQKTQPRNTRNRTETH